MHSLSVLLFSTFLVILLPLARGYTWYTGEQRLTEFQTKYANSKSDIFFLIDNSGSLWKSNGQNGFYDEKAFVSSVLSKIKIAKRATRVAIIRFGDSATIDINYVTNLNAQNSNNKCEFVKSFSQVGYTGVMTNMREGFLRVKDILFGVHSADVRPWKKFGQTTNVNKVVFLLTDGYWNRGGNPADQIQFLKTEKVEIFTIGITNVDQNFLKNAATSTDRYFYYNEFKDFRELATHIRGDAYQLDYDTDMVPKDKCSNRCDTNADCGCGLLSGKYVCICHVGYYGSGSVGGCTACQPGTYKDYVGLATKGCKRCPNHSGHSKHGSARITDCVCDKGYEGNPGSGRDCTIKRCLGLSKPDDGYTNPSDCSQDYGTTCAFHCNAGFKLDGEKTLTCTVSSNNVGGAFWTPKATVAECKRIVCPSYRVSNAVTENGDCDNSDRRVGTKCSYSCLRGYRRVGSSERVCQVDETWSGQPTKCEVVTCPALNSLTLATINDRDCTEKPMRFDSKCIFSCPNGYAFNISRQQSLTRVCQDTGIWDGTYQVCKDILAPTFTYCPRNKIFTYNTTFRLNSSEVTWRVAEYHDNSLTIDSNHKVTLTEANNYAPPHIFGIGTHSVSYTVTDKEGHQSFCEFSIKVEDHEAPYYVKCPGKVLKETKVLKERIVWDEPEFVDNSGKDVVITSNRLNSDYFFVGQTMVFYTANDDFGNKNTSCAFEVHVKKVECVPFKTPKDGALAVLNAGTLMYTPYCRQGYDFGYKPSPLYFCSGGQWQTWPMGGKLPWPDCAVRNDPSSGSLKMTSSFYFSGDCNDEEVQTSLKNTFVTSLKDFRVFPPTFCVFNANCKVENVNIVCGETTPSRRRRRRGVQKEVYISVDYVVKLTQGSTQGDFQTLKQNMNSQLLNVARQKVQQVDWKSGMNLDEVKKPTIKSSEPYCSGKKGAVVGRCDYLTNQQCNENNYHACLCNGETGTIEKCIECPIGKFYNVMTSKCEICNDGTFQDVEGQFGCKKCAPGFSTFGNDAKNFTLCKAICKPGYYSSTGLAPCYACPYGQYSTDEWSKSCKTCPQGTLTVLPAATKIEDCGMKCAPGTYSSNGVEPCTPCPKGTYQAGEGKLSCIHCEGSRSTYGPGAKTISHCIEINECDSNPCNNGAKCKDLKDKYECTCQPGYSGRNCEIEDSECLSNPCYDNAVCVDKISGYQCICAKGYTGPNCDEPIPQCNLGNNCRNGGKCTELPGGYGCECRNGYSGKYCEVDVNDCASTPCKNGGACQDGINTFTCSCKPGFSGKQCEVNTDDCASDPCKNRGSCMDQVNGYLCKCILGYVGKNCEIKFNWCAPNPCQNRGKCVNKLDGFECQCAPTFSGRTCATEHSIQFDLSFPTYEVPTFSKATLRQNLYALTLAFWMRTRDQENVGTPVSYSVNQGGYLEENAIVLKDYGNFAIQINNQTGYTGDPVNDGQWHHVAVTWQSSDGTWVYYRDGKEIKRAAEPLAKGDFIRNGGEVVLAQEQDWEAAEDKFAYNPLEAFLGDMSQMTIWNKVLSPHDIYNLAGSCASAELDAIVVAWADFVPGLQGSYKKTDRSHACDFSSPLRHFDTIYKARIPSNDDKTLNGVSAKDCATLCEQESSFACRSFDYHSASSKCILSKAYRETVAVVSSNNEEYDYYELSCLDRLGLESGVIPDLRLSSSAPRNAYSGAKEARTNRRKLRGVAGMPDSDGGWIPQTFNHNQYLQIDLGKKMKVTGVETQGADGQTFWVRSYSLQHSINGQSWTSLTQILPGNLDNKGKIKNQINLQTRYIRILPKSWSNGIGMRVELYGCSLDPEGVPTDLASVKSAHSETCSWETNNGECCTFPFIYNGKSYSSCTTVNNGNTLWCSTTDNYDTDKKWGNCKPEETCSWETNNGECCAFPFIYNGKNYGSCTTVNNGNTLWCSTTDNYDTDRKWGNCKPEGSCNPTPCHNGGLCSSLPYGYVCTCPIGFVGKNCQTALSCDDPGTPINGHRSSKNFNPGQSIVFGCNNGYQLSGSSSRTCVNGKWTGSKATCLNINECTLGICNQHCADSLGSYMCSCVIGYRLASNHKTCQDINECSEHGCSHGCINTQGSFRCTCPSGMKLDSSGTRCEDINECASRNHGCEHNCFNIFKNYQCHCKGGYTLEKDGRSCQEIYCPQPLAPINGKFAIVGDTILGNSVKYACNDGFNMVGSDQRICQANRKWSGTQPRCQAIRCVEVGNVGHGDRQGNSRGYNNHVTFTCHSTYRLIGTSTRTCQKTSTWSNEQPICVPNYCPALIAPAHGRINGFRTELLATVGVSCDVGYKVVGTSFRTCEKSRNWSGSDPTCQLVDCGDPGIPNNGYRHGNYYKYNSIINFTCKSKHHLEGEREIKCLANGKWSAARPKCLARSCGNPGVPYNGFKHGESHTYNSVVQYTCQKGYTLVGDRARTCEESTAKWTGSLPSCQLVSCGVQTAPKYGFRVGEKFTYNEVLRFDCEPGYKLLGSNYRRCQATGIWSGDAPSCTRTSCGSFKHGPSGVIESPNFPNDYGKDLYCTWQINVPKGKKVRIEFKEFKTEESKDFVYIFDTGKTDPIIAFSGVTYKPLPLTSSGNSLRIRFVSNGAMNSNGFQLHYSQVDCGGMFTETKGTISSPNYKGQYPSNADCSWLINLPKKRIGINFLDFNTQRSYDRLTIYDGPYSSMKRLFDWSGIIAPYGYVKTTNYMYLRFTSSKSNDKSYHGFTGKYEQYLYNEKK